MRYEFNYSLYDRINDDFLAIRKEYMALEPGYSSRNYLIGLRKRLDELYAQCRELIRVASYEYTYTTDYRKVLLDEITLDVLNAAPDKMAISHGEKEARTSDRYLEFLDDQATAHANYKAVTHLYSSINSLTNTVASEIKGHKETYE